MKIDYEYVKNKISRTKNIQLENFNGNHYKLKNTISNHYILLHKDEFRSIFDDKVRLLSNNQ